MQSIRATAFLAENAEFAEGVIAAGLTWVGPDPQTLRDMGDKERARAIARRADVPIVPGSDRVGVGSDVDIATLARTVGYPLLVKAAAGGGGIGMRLVEHEDKLSRTVEATQKHGGKSLWRRDRILLNASLAMHAMWKFRSSAMATGRRFICSSAIARCNAVSRR